MLPGAQVQLLTGGPIMTAEEMLPNGEIKCSWTDDTAKTAGRVLRTGRVDFGQS
jgi:uncharacterized protein YodC (DUF2158 family)